MNTARFKVLKIFLWLKVKGIGVIIGVGIVLAGSGYWIAPLIDTSLDDTFMGQPVFSTVDRLILGGLLMVAVSCGCILIGLIVYLNWRKAKEIAERQQ